jgi:hypothetical protein
VVTAGVTVVSKKDEQSAEPCLVGNALPRRVQILVGF